MDIIRGTYQDAGRNCGKAFFRKYRGDNHNPIDLIYYEDSSDEDGEGRWLFGSCIRYGPDHDMEVYADSSDPLYAIARLPPVRGWRIGTLDPDSNPLGTSCPR